MTPRRLRMNAATLWLDAPFVIALRLHQMQMAALAGKSQDAAELQRMITEKVAATAESAVAVNIALWRTAFDTTLRVMTGGQASATRSGTAIASAALQPYGRRVRHNARRLSGKKS